MKTKTFDCVEMKRQGSRRIYEQIKDLTPEEELAFWRKRSARLKNRIKTAQTKARNPASSRGNARAAAAGFGAQGRACVMVARTFTPARREWYEPIRAHVMENLSIGREDFEEPPVLTCHGG